MTYVHSSTPMENPALLPLLPHTPKKPSKSSTTTTRRRGSFFRFFKLLPMLSTGCKMVALLATTTRHQRRKPVIHDKAATGTLFGYRKGRLNLAIQEDPHCPPFFVIELPILASTLHKEMDSSDVHVIRISLETNTKTVVHKKKLLEESVWGVYLNGRKMGYSIRKGNMMSSCCDETDHVMMMLKGVSMGAGVLPPSSHQAAPDGGELMITYVRARLDRVLGSKDSEAYYMMNPDGSSMGQELSIFFLRIR